MRRLARVVALLLATSSAHAEEGKTCIDNCHPTGGETTSSEGSTPSDSSSSTSAPSDSDGSSESSAPPFSAPNPFGEWHSHRSQQSPARNWPARNYLITIDMQGRVVDPGHPSAHEREVSARDAKRDIATPNRAPIPFLGIKRPPTRKLLEAGAEVTKSQQVDKRAEAHHQIATDTLLRSHDIIGKLFDNLTDPEPDVFGQNLADLTDVMPDYCDPSGELWKLVKFACMPKNAQ
jgi:hypothetical protein